MGLFEEVSDRVRHHVGLLCFRCQAGVVKDCNDGDEGDCIGKGELRVFGAVRDLSKSVGSRNGNGGFGHLFLNLLSISVQAKGSEMDNNLGMKKTSIDGKQYLDYF
jgi:hypothetical protein